MIPRNKNIKIICFLTAILLLTLSGCSFRKKQEVNPSTIVEQAAADAGLPNVTELVESLTEEYGEVPAAILQAGLMLVDVSYQYRSPVSPTSIYTNHICPAA